MIRQIHWHWDSTVELYNQHMARELSLPEYDYWSSELALNVCRYHPEKVAKEALFQKWGAYGSRRGFHFEKRTSPLDRVLLSRVVDLSLLRVLGVHSDFSSAIYPQPLYACAEVDGYLNASTFQRQVPEGQRGSDKVIARDAPLVMWGDRQLLRAMPPEDPCIIQRKNGTLFPAPVLVVDNLMISSFLVLDKDADGVES